MDGSYIQNMPIRHNLNEAGEYLYLKCLLKYWTYSEYIYLIKGMAGCGENAKGPFLKV